MIYSNDDPMALAAMEIARTGNYGNDFMTEDMRASYCPMCGAFQPEYYYLDDDEECIGCSECVYKTDVLF